MNIEMLEEKYLHNKNILLVRERAEKRIQHIRMLNK